MTRFFSGPSWLVPGAGGVLARSFLTKKCRSTPSYSTQRNTFPSCLPPPRLVRHPHAPPPATSMHVATELTLFFEGGGCCRWGPTHQGRTTQRLALSSLAPVANLSRMGPTLNPTSGLLFARRISFYLFYVLILFIIPALIVPTTRRYVPRTCLFLLGPFPFFGVSSPAFAHTMASVRSHSLVLSFGHPPFWPEKLFLLLLLLPPTPSFPQKHTHTHATCGPRTMPLRAVHHGLLNGPPRIYGAGHERSRLQRMHSVMFAVSAEPRHTSKDR